MKVALVIGLILSIIFDLVQLWLSRGNDLLVGLGVLVIFISIAGIVANCVEVEEELELKWAVFYTIPFGMLAFGLIASHESRMSTR